MSLVRLRFDRYPAFMRIIPRLILFLALTLLAACQPAQPTGNITPLATVNALSPQQVILPSPTGKICQPEPVTAPTQPATIPGYTELDETTGLHVTGTAVKINLASYRLRVTGKVDNPLELTYDELRCMPKVTARPVLICPGIFEDVATWSGVPLTHLLGLAGIQEEAKNLQLVSADGYKSFILLSEALIEDNFLAYEWEDEPLPVLHGFPVRAIMPSMQGSKWVKWLVEIQVE